jgi:hypothetical protein
MCNGFFDRSDGFVAWSNVCSPACKPKLILAMAEPIQERVSCQRYGYARAMGVDNAKPYRLCFRPVVSLCSTDPVVFIIAHSYSACHNCLLKSVSLLGLDRPPIARSWLSSLTDSTWIFVSVTMLMPSWRIGLMIESCDPVRVGLLSTKDSWCFDRIVWRPRRGSTIRESLLLPPTMVTVRAAVVAIGSLAVMDERP